MNDTKPELPYRIHALELGPMENFIYVIEDIAAAAPPWSIPPGSRRTSLPSSRRKA